jgi:hypothetical protein
MILWILIQQEQIGTGEYGSIAGGDSFAGCHGYSADISIHRSAS